MTALSHENSAEHPFTAFRASSERSIAARSRRARSGLLSLVLLVSLSGCQALTPRVAAPTPTPILLPAQPATPQPVAVPETTGMAATRPAASAAAEAVVATRPVAAGATVTATAAAADGLLALGTRAAIVLRAQAAADAAIVGQAPGSQVLWAYGRSPDGKWLWVSYDDAGRQAWVAAGHVKLIGDVQSLDVISPTTAAAVAATTSPQAAPRPAATAIPPRGKIAFQTAIGGAIYVVNADGTGLRQVAVGFDPALSPDGAQLAYVRWGAPDGLYLLDLKTGAERQLATAQRPRSPVWSPDGTQIIFSHTTGERTCLDSPFGCMSEEQLRAIFGGQECIDTPRGRLCIGDFGERRVELTDLVQLTLADGSQLDLPAERKSQSPTWRPDGSEVVYVGESGLQVLPLGQIPRVLLRGGTLGSPIWSPDGQRLLVQDYKHDHWEIVLLDAAGNVLAQLTASAASAARKPNNVAPAWSPDGKSVLFLSDRDGAWRLYRMNADGSGQELFLASVLKDIPFNYDFAAERVVSWVR